MFCNCYVRLTLMVYCFNYSEQVGNRHLFLFICLAQSMTSTLVHIANMTNLSQEATSKDKSLKTQLLLLTGNEKKADTDKKRNRAGFLED